MLKPIVLILPAALALAACAPKPAPQVAIVDPYAGQAQPVAPAVATASDFAASATPVVSFAADSVVLDDGARSALAGQASWLDQNPGFSAMIEGHAAETEGTRAYAAALAARRAGAVEEYLIASGIAPLRLRTVSFGKERPAALCSTEECYSQNRRVRTVVSPGVGS